MHYQKMIVVLNETIQLMHKIDEIINKQGGWPSAFRASSIKSTSEPGARDTRGLARAAENGPAYGKKKGDCDLTWVDQALDLLPHCS
ncbi:MAG: hypothetical protein NTW97_05660 [Candidatus Krumholzibacteria bacterium]|nr:hypothetical protein [Candidatus Krumholzibacteria bacterium]